VALLGSNLSYYFDIDAKTAGVVFAAAVVMLFVLVREFIRHAFFVYMLPGNVLLIDIVCAVVLLGVAYRFTTVGRAPALHTIAAIGGAGIVGGV